MTATAQSWNSATQACAGKSSGPLSRYFPAISKWQIIAGSSLIGLAFSLATLITFQWYLSRPPLRFEVISRQTTLNGEREMSSLKVKVENHSNHPIKLLGGSHCGESGCVYAEPFPTTIAPQESAILLVDVNAKPGRLSDVRLNLFIDDASSLKEIMVPLE